MFFLMKGIYQYYNQVSLVLQALLYLRYCYNSRNKNTKYYSHTCVKLRKTIPYKVPFMILCPSLYWLNATCTYYSFSKLSYVYRIHLVNISLVHIHTTYRQNIKLIFILKDFTHQTNVIFVQTHTR